VFRKHVAYLITPALAVAMVLLLAAQAPAQRRGGGFRGGYHYGGYSRGFYRGGYGGYYFRGYYPRYYGYYSRSYAYYPRYYGYYAGYYRYYPYAYCGWGYYPSYYADYGPVCYYGQPYSMYGAPADGYQMEFLPLGHPLALLGLGAAAVPLAAPLAL
jgi:hypothetical protein